MNETHRITFAEAELLQMVMAEHIRALEKAAEVGALDAVAVASFLGYAGAEMDSVDESLFQEVIKDRLCDLRALQKKLKHVFGI